MKKLLTIILALLPVLAFSQIKYDSVRVVKPQNFVEALSIDTAIVQIISQKAGVNRRVNFQTVADWILAQQPNLDSAQYANDTLLLFYGADTILAIIPSGTIDTAYLSGDTLGIVFAGDTTEVVLAGLGDGNGIYSGSGTVPASTWVEQLGSLIFDIDSLGSFTVGDIDEKSTGAIISVSNSGGNDGQINIRSGSGAGYTDATVVVNNYSMPGTTPSGEGLPTGDYMWIVSQGGIRKGQDSTGWIHIDSLLNGYTTGSGTSGTLPIWSSSTALGNSSLTEASGVLSSSLTGALKLPAGTDAQDPVWSAGMLRYNTTTNGVQGYDGTAERYLPWMNTTDLAIPYYDAADKTLKAGPFRSTTANSTNLDSRTIIFNNAGANPASPAGLSFEGFSWLYGTSGSPTLKLGAGRFFDFRDNSAIRHRFSANGNVNFYAGTLRMDGSTPIDIAGGYTFTHNTRAIPGLGNPSVLDLKANFGASGGRYFVLCDSISSNVKIAFGIQTIDLMKSFYGRVIWANTSTSPVIDHIYVSHADTLKKATPSSVNAFLGHFAGTISTSTDASGDIVVAHGMGVTPTSVQVTVTGTTPYIVTVHSIDATNFTVRFFDTSGAAVVSTAVTATWHAKT